MPRIRAISCLTGCRGCGCHSMHDAVAELFWGKPGGLFESDAEAVRALVTAQAGEDFEFMVGFGQESFGAVDAHALEFLSRGPADIFYKSLVQPASGHGGDADEVFDADGLAGVFPNEAEAVGDAFVPDGQQVAALACDDSSGRHTDGLERRFAAVHEVSQERRAGVAESFKVR